ncbi:hypothetical protein ACFS7Z_21365 [Pontibacter toksunensis]|uniref:Uncharacterized protein n=1 Tax=Pontibacter toksunensis TaxID=1332631 RepID=A0ABW6BYQ3_9BACT
MNNLWQKLSKYLPIAALVLLCMVVVPAAQANTGSNGGASTASAEGMGSNGGTTVTANAQQTNGQAAAANDPAKGKQKVTTKPRDKSVLDAEVLESPIGYFKNAFSSEEDSSEAAPSSNAVMLTVKALVATLLSTIM